MNEWIQQSNDTKHKNHLYFYTLTEQYEKKLQNSIHYSIKKYLEINQEGERFAQWKLQNTVEDKWKQIVGLWIQKLNIVKVSIYPKWSI